MHFCALLQGDEWELVLGYRVSCVILKLLEPGRF